MSLLFLIQFSGKLHQFLEEQLDIRTACIVLVDHLLEAFLVVHPALIQLQHALEFAGDGPTQLLCLYVLARPFEMRPQRIKIDLAEINI